MRARVLLKLALIYLIAVVSLVGCASAQENTDPGDVLLRALGQLDRERRAVSAASFSAASSQIIFGTDDGSLYINDVSLSADVTDDLKIVDSRHAARVLDIAHSLDGTWFVSGGADGTIRVFDSDTGVELKHISPRLGWINAVAISEDGTLFAAGFDDGSTRVWDRTDWVTILQTEPLTSPVTALAFGPTNDRFAVGHFDGTVLVYGDAEELRISSQAGNITRLAYSPIDERLAIGTSSGVISIYDLKVRRVLQTFGGHQGAINALTYTEDGRQLLSAGDDGQALIIDTLSGIQRNTGFPQEGNLQGIGLIGVDLVAAVRRDGSIRAWNKKDINPGLLNLSSNRAKQIGLTPDNRFVVVAPFEGRFIFTEGRKLRSSAFEFRNTRNRTTDIQLPGAVSIVWSSRGQFAVATDGQSHFQLSRDFIESLPNGTPSFQSEPQIQLSGSSNVVAVSDDGSLAIASSPDGILQVILLPAEKAIAELFVGDSLVFTASLSPKKDKVAVVLEDNEILILEIPDGSLSHSAGSTESMNSRQEATDQRVTRSSSTRLVPIQNFTSPFQSVDRNITSIAFSTDGRSLIVATERGIVEVFDSLTGIRTHVPQSLGNGDLRSCRLALEICLRAGLVDPIRSPVVPAPPLISQISSTPPTLDVLDDGLPYTDQQTGLVVLPLIIGNHGGKAHSVFIETSVSLPENGKGPDIVPIAMRPIPVVENGHPIRRELRFVPRRVGTNPTDDGTTIAKVTVSDISGRSNATIEVPIEVASPQLVLARTVLAPSTNEAPATLIAFLSNEGAAPSLPVAGKLWVGSGSQQTMISDEVIAEPIQPGSQVEIAVVLSGGLSDELVATRKPISASLELVERPPPEWPNVNSNWKLSAEVLIDHSASWAIYFAYVAVFLVATGFLFTGLQQHPLVARLTREPEKLLALAPDQLARADWLMRVSLRRQGILSGAGVSTRRLRLGKQYTEATVDQKIEFLSDRLGLKVARAVSADKKLMVWLAETPQDFLINLPRFKVIVPEDDLEAEEVVTRVTREQGVGEDMAVVLIKGTTKPHRVRKGLSQSSVFAVAPTAADTTQILIGPEPLTAFYAMVSGQLRSPRLSIYQTGLAVRHARSFYGRERELNHIMNRAASNYLVVGGRQIGKSSLLLEIRRRVTLREGKAIYHSVGDGDPFQRIGETLGCSAAEVPAALRRFRGTTTGPVYILIDEADQFISRQLSGRAEQLWEMRTLSEEGVANFILAGFWQLYNAATTEYHSPLMNFGEILEIGALEQNSAEDLVTQPLGALGLKFQDEAQVKRLVSRTGSRANILVLCCAEIIRIMPITEDQISPEVVEAAVGSDSVLGALAGWNRLSGGTALEDDLLDGLIVLGLASGSATTVREIQVRLDGLPITVHQIRESISRLRLAYILDAGEHRSLKIAVPLLTEELRETDLDAALTQQLGALREAYG